MTEQQIKQNAEQYALKKTLVSTDSFHGMVEDYIAGAHSRDEEIERIKNEATAIMDEACALTIELNKLRNPWISVEERLPEKYLDCDGVEHDCSDRVIVKLKDETCAHLAEYYYDTNEWLSLEVCSSTDYYENVTHWMPIPDIH